MERNLEKYLCTCCHTSQTKTHCKSTIVQFFFQSCSYHVPQSHVTRSTHPLWGTLPPNISLFMRIHQANTNWETIPKHLKMTIPKCQGHTRSGKTEKLSQLGRDSWRKRRREGRKRGEKSGRKMAKDFPTIRKTWRRLGSVFILTSSLLFPWHATGIPYSLLSL